MHAGLVRQAKELEERDGISFDKAYKKVEKEELRIALHDAVDRTDIFKIKKFLGIS